MSAALKECPHCGAPAMLEDHRTVWAVKCTSTACATIMLGERAPEPDGEMGDAYWNGIKQTAIDSWNARAIAPPVAAGSVDKGKIDDLLVALSIAAIDVSRGGHSDIHRDAALELINAIDAWGAQLIAEGAQGLAQKFTLLESAVKYEKAIAEKAEARLKELEAALAKACPNVIDPSNTAC